MIQSAVPDVSPSTLEVVPLGGLGEFGMNMMAVSWEDTTILIDAGVMFPDPDQLGVDLIVPDMTFVESRRNNVVELLRRLQDRFEQVILITHIESVREGLDHIINVRYDEETGASVVSQTDETEVELTGANAAEVDDAYEEFEATG